jgi:hypothetical protein
VNHCHAVDKQSARAECNVRHHHCAISAKQACRANQDQLPNWDSRQVDRPDLGQTPSERISTHCQQPCWNPSHAKHSVKHHTTPSHGKASLRPDSCRVGQPPCLHTAQHVAGRTQAPKCSHVKSTSAGYYIVPLHSIRHNGQQSQRTQGVASTPLGHHTSVATNQTQTASARSALQSCGTVAAIRAQLLNTTGATPEHPVCRTAWVASSIF